jgi:hypothetical protein
MTFAPTTDPDAAISTVRRRSVVSLLVAILAVADTVLRGGYVHTVDRSQGKLADLVVLNQNIAKVPRDDISKTEPLLTMVGGKRVWVDPSMRSAWGGEQSWAGS